MSSNVKSIEQALKNRPDLIKKRIDEEELEHFKEKFLSLFDNQKESEEHHKALIRDLLKSIYKEKYYINTFERIDLVIHNDKDYASPRGVLFEIKSPTNKGEMVSHHNLNVKSFQELVLYYLRERITRENIKLRHLIITNISEWYVFDAQDFGRLFYQNKSFCNLFEEFKRKTLSEKNNDLFYKGIASPEIKKLQEDIPYTYFNLRDYDPSNSEDDRKLILLYKFLSPACLLKLPPTNNSTQLNEEFYVELLHIIGLKEIEKDSRKVIVRKEKGEREEGSLIENAISFIDDRDKLDQLEEYGETREEQLFHVALDLSITWINRILFLKLLEAQIIKYHNGEKDFSFLSIDKIADYDEIDTLFFSVLACREEERKDYIKDKFKHVPYLNSSLFEKTEVENKIMFICCLNNNFKIKPYPKTVLHDAEDTMLPLEYLLRFLDSYDFGSEGMDGLQEANKPLISASVLGLIFEKINGYKDGSFFTPSNITMYMCRETIQRVVIQKFNKEKNWNCQTITGVYNKINDDDIEEAKEIFDSIRICDPSVGSGHFLVSALNEMIYLKHKLGILTDRNGRKLKDIDVSVRNDELVILDEEGSSFVYNPKNPASSLVQEAFFNEKRNLIENCLFGVDINPNSVKIARLRLWIELLKHAYYTTTPPHSVLGIGRLETLPNIDINIKQGDSLISRFDLHGDYTKLPLGVQQLRSLTKEYKKEVATYKREDNKENKKSILENIKRIKGEFERINNPYEQNKAFYSNAFEWTYEFPEVLDEEGNFVGFDIVISNPPYIQLQKNKGELGNKYKECGYETFERTGDIYSLFYERGYHLLKPKGRLCFITSNKWMRTGYGTKLRKFFTDKTNPKMLFDFAGKKMFDVGTVDTSILLFAKEENKKQTKACVAKKEISKEDLSEYFKQNFQICDFNSDYWIILCPIEKSIKAKIEKIGTPLKDWKEIEINYGIKTGLNEAFIISEEKRQKLIKENPNSNEILVRILRGRDIKRYRINYADLWLINTHSGIKEKGIERVDIDNYPAVKKHLDSYGERLTNRSDQGDTPYNLRDCAYMENFYKKKLIYSEIVREPQFYFDEKGFFLPEASTWIMTGEYLKFLYAVLQTKAMGYFFKNFYAGGRVR